MPLHITMRQLQVFEAVARHLSFTRAAEELHLTQPAVSMQVKQLSSIIDMPLFEQLGKKVYLTEVGKAVLRHSKTMMGQLDEIERDMNCLRGIEGGHLKLCIASTVNYFATRLLSRFYEIHSSVKISLDVINRQKLIKQLDANIPDIVLMGQPPDDLDVESRAFMNNPLIIIASPKHHLVGQLRIPVSAMTQETFIMREPGSGTRQAMNRVFDNFGVTPKMGVQLSSNETVKQAVEAGLGLAVVSKHTVNLELEVGRLKVLDVENFPIIRKWYIVYRRGKQLSITAKTFMDFVLRESDNETLNPEISHSS